MKIIMDKKINSSGGTVTKPSAPVAFFLLSGRENKIIFASQSIAGLSGKVFDSIINKPMLEVFPEQIIRNINKILKNVYRNRKIYHTIENPVTTFHEGKLRTIYQNFSFEPYLDAIGNILGIFVAITDVTELVNARRREQQLENELGAIRGQLELEQNEKKERKWKKDDFIGVASHELKTPLTSLTALVQVLGKKLKDNDDQPLAALLEKANFQVKKMSNLINKFLNVSRLEMGKLFIEKSHFVLDGLIDDIIEEFNLTVISHKLELVPCDKITVYADREKIGSVISNLLTNAVKYSPRANKVVVTCNNFYDYVMVSVKDGGIGLEKQHINKIFDRYYRVETTETQHISGFGIGLYLSAEIIRAHCGKIWVDSKVGQGSIFYFTLPTTVSDSVINP
jgi:two-component system, OmpR family, sensor histidine kinase VicK